jgi:hypothetical protein
LGGRPAGVGWKQGLFCGKECAVMSSIPFFARRRLCSTFNAQEVGQLRAALQGAGDGLIVTPKDIDTQVHDLAKVIGYGINLALHTGLTIGDVELFLS